MGKKIVLYYGDIRLSELTETNNGYKHSVNEKNVEKAIIEGCPPHIGAEKTKEYEVNDIPPSFYDFEINPHRQDSRKYYEIQRGDSRFEKLYKVALKSGPKSDDFWICIEE